MRIHVQMLARNWLGKEEEETGGAMKVIMDGAMPSLAVFLLVWSTLNTVLVWT